MTSLVRSVAWTATTSAVHALATDGKDDGDAPKYQDQARGQRDLFTQIAVSIALGLSAFMTFCVRFCWMIRVSYGGGRVVEWFCYRLLTFVVG